jgi:hypothetical protein
MAAAALAAAGRAGAGLGEPVAAVAEDRRALAAEARAPVVARGYTVEQMASAAHEVREFVSPEGLVFAVAWDGISNPDLTRLLGPYAPEALDAAGRTHARGRRRRVVRTDRVVVETWGHMRSLHGRAYAPSLVPPGVSLDAIR